MPRKSSNNTAQSPNQRKKAKVVEVEDVAPSEPSEDESSEKKLQGELQNIDGVQVRILYNAGVPSVYLWVEDAERVEDVLGEAKDICDRQGIPHFTIEVHEKGGNLVRTLQHPPPVKNDSNNRAVVSKPPTSGTWGFRLILCVCVCVAGAVCFRSAVGGGEPARDPSSFVSEFDAVEQLLSKRSGFASREKLLGSLVAHIPNTKPERPLCIFTASSDSGARAFGFELSKAILHNTTRAMDLKGASLAGREPFEAMREMQQHINRHFESITTGSVVISDVDKIRAEDITRLIWEFCDDDTASFKRGVFIFTSTIPGLDECGEEEAIDAAVKAYFEKLWASALPRGFDPFWIRAARLVLTSGKCEF